ncbi:hydroxyacid dehydrogenase [Burkholderia cepacia]|uniref:UdgX family uracil-DNA binding protein n=1 Tax=Burkholderia cepacia TaxID=292 RepID=UPI000753214F|nr:UdgX family uracil-DNA binding protein [Burkholderia cepacia]KVV64983.1 hydroxyacid dehydrogenase [Burkholderia cepacia]KVV82489.1 hydroxyacid dehydrogenase [Burkholderia cepacia]KVV86166.1 hydroxyacid dehydrogenase [Burkholderia cepacia]KVV89868.1 hydroxyacid dehydrogenase [Burkholderia cepacia]KVV96235.1 hydroxyacid dehydrogenase [Burkholderia cepacia]
MTHKPPPAPASPPAAIDDDDAPTTLGACRRCALWEHATQPVPGAGPRDASIMLVGEQPGDQEDRAGVPFVGAAGRLLDRALDEAGVERTHVYLTNAVKHFKWEPRGKRRLHKTPAQREVAACRYWLERELDAVRPRVVVALGATALCAVLQDNDATLERTRAPVRTAGGQLVVATFHPSYVLRTRGADSREHAYRTLVDALRTASDLAHDTRRGGGRDSHGNAG